MSFKKLSILKKQKQEIIENTEKFQLTQIQIQSKHLGLTQKTGKGFPGDAVVKNLPANAGATGSSPGPGRSHMLWSN